MNSEVITIRCFWYPFTFVTADVFCHLSKLHDDYKVTRLDYDLIVDFTLDDNRVRVILSDRFESNAHVCVVVPWIQSYSWFSRQVKDWVSICATKHPTAPIIIHGYRSDKRFDPDKIIEADLEGVRLMNRRLGDQLANEVGAVKYVEYSIESGRGVKALIDEIAFAGLGKMKDDEEQQGLDNLCSIFCNIFKHKEMSNRLKLFQKLIKAKT